MRRAILAFVVAAGVGGFVSSSNAQDSKKPPHPAAAANQSLQQRGVEVPSSNTPHPGEASPGSPKPRTGDAVVSGGKSTAHSRQNN
jgi:hypothetical protein